MQFQGKMQEKAVDYKTALILWRLQGQTARASVPSLCSFEKELVLEMLPLRNDKWY